MDELEAELQRANNKVCHTGHLLNQMTIKVPEPWFDSMHDILHFGLVTEYMNKPFFWHRICNIAGFISLIS